MCEQCVVIPYHYGEVFPGVLLIRARRETSTSEMELYDWGLLFINDPFVIFKTTPVRPSSEDDKETMARFDKFADEFNSTIEFEQMFELYETFRVDMLAEYDKDWEVEGIYKDVPMSICLEKTMAYIYLKIADFIPTSNPEPEVDPFPDINGNEGVKLDLDYDPKMV